MMIFRKLNKNRQHNGRKKTKDKSGKYQYHTPWCDPNTIRTQDLPRSETRR